MLSTFAHRLLLVLALASTLAAPAAAQSAKPDFSGWQILLDRYAMRLGGKGQPLDTRFDYEQLFVDEDVWHTGQSQRLMAIRRQLLATPPSGLAERDRLAWAINTYNFLVVERATLHLLVPGAKFVRYRSVSEMIYSVGGFFDAPAVQIEGRDYSIGEFERVFVFGDSTPVDASRAKAADPRIAFALCPASMGGPPLAMRAFRAESLETQLDGAARTALALPRFVHYDETVRALEVSEFFHTNRVDYDGAAGVVRFLERFGPAPVRNGIHRDKLTTVARYAAMDGKLNQFERPKSKPPLEGAPPAAKG